MSPPTHSWANDARGSRDVVGRVAVPATSLPSLAPVDAERGADLVVELGQALFGVRVVVVRGLQLGRVVVHDAGCLQVQGADQLDRDLKRLVERAASAVGARGTAV